MILKSTLLIRGLASLFVLASLGLSGTALGQFDEDMETAKNFPPKYIGRDTAEMTLEKLQWAVDRKKMTEDMILERIASASGEVQVLQSARLKSVDALPEEFRFADDKARSEAASRCLQELLTVRLDLATHNALLEELATSEPTEIDQEQQELVARQYQVRLRIRESEMQQAEKQIKHLQGLVERGFADKSQVGSAELELAKARADVETEILNLKIHEQKVAAPVSREMAEMRRQIRGLQARESAARQFLQQLNETAGFSQKIRRLEEAIQIKHEMLNRLSHQQFDLQNELDEYRILQKQVSEALEKLPKRDDD